MKAGIANVADQHAAVNTFPGLVPLTPREFVTEVGGVTFWSQPPKVGQMIGGEVVTR